MSDGRDGKLFSRREFSQTHDEDSSPENETSLKIFRKTIDNILSLVNTSADRKDFPLFYSTNIATLRRDLAQCLKITILYISRTDT